MDSSCKKVLSVIVIILLFLFLIRPIFDFATGLFFNTGKLYNLISGENPPYKQLGSLWISEEPYISLQVAEYTSTIQDATSYVIKDGERIDVDFYLEPGRPVRIDKKGYYSNGNLLVGHIIDWSSTEVTIAVDSEDLFDGAYETIILTRINP